MTYRKFKADHIFSGTEILSGDNVLITDENGVVETIINEAEAGDDIQNFEGLLSPGFINCHCHLELSHMKNVVETGTGLVDFLITVVGKRGFDKATILEAIEAADAEMYENGIVAVGDICNTTDTIQTKLNSKIQYRNFIEAIGFTEERAAAIFERFRNLHNDFLAPGLINTAIVPHAPYTMSKAMFGLINDFSANKSISIHNQETSAENELYRTKTGDFFRLYDKLGIDTTFFNTYNQNSLPAYLPFLDKIKSLLLVHNSFTTQSDIKFAMQQSQALNQQIFWCLCPNANLYIENKIPDIELFINNDCKIILGTDSYSSNWGLSILDEMKTLQKNFPQIKLKTMLQWATLNGASALEINKTLGSFEKNKRPGINLINNINQSRLTNSSSVKKII